MDKKKNLHYIINKYVNSLYDSGTTRNSKTVKTKTTMNLRQLHRRAKIRKYRQIVRRRKEIECVFSKLFSKKLKLFACCLCGNMLHEPVTVECGHTFCGSCLNFENCARQCAVCNQTITNRNSVNVLIQKMLDKWKESNKYDLNGHMLATTTNTLGIEPRYLLRSRYAGIHINLNQLDEAICDLKPVCDNSDNKSTKRRTHRNFKRDIVLPQNFESSLQNIFKEVEIIQENSLKQHWNLENDLDCILCGQSLLEPVTTPCGHTFCRECLTRVLDHRLNCPLCMSALSVDDYSREITKDLDEAIKLLLPLERKIRILSRYKEIKTFDNGYEVPVFICTNAFPGVACPLYVHEPHYRLLTRRCLQTTKRRFAMVAKDNNLDNKFVSYGTLLEVKDAVKLQDGRFILTTVGLRRFRVLSRGEQDGYDLARIHYIRDCTIPEEKIEEITMLHTKVYNKASKWVSSLTPKACTEVERLIGKMPFIEYDWMFLPDGPSWTWWLMPILPLSPQLQMVFLSTTSLEKRLRAIDKMLEHMKIRMQSLERENINTLKPIRVADPCHESYDIS